MNRYSRTVTQPKDQGASQVSFLVLLSITRMKDLRLMGSNDITCLGDAVCYRWNRANI